MRHLIVHGLFCLLIVNISGCTRSVEIIAHRGASYIAPENTMASVMLGWEKDTDVEVDVYLTKDDKIVVIHDENTKRTAVTDVNVAETTSDELRKLDVGSFKSEEYAGGKIPFLADIVETIPTGKKLYVEIKCGQEILPYLRELLFNSGKKVRLITKFGRKLSEQNTVIISQSALDEMAAEPGDLLYASHIRWWYGGPRSVHIKAGKPSESEDKELIRISPEDAAMAHFTEGRQVTVEKII